MLLQEKNLLKDFLYDASQKFATHATAHIDIVLLCGSLGIEVIRSSKVDFKTALLVKEELGYQIKLSQKETNRNGYTLFEEFLIAHEIGHLLIERKYSVKPHRTKEYWEFEELCNYFARMLLLPDGYIRKKLNGLKAEPLDLLELSNQIAKEAQVYWPVAAHRLAEIFPDCGFFRTKYDVVSSGDRYFKIDMTTLENNKEMGRKFWLENEIGRKFASMTKNGDDISLEQSIFTRPDVMKTFPSFCNGKDGYAYRKNNREIRFIIKFS
ncbi:MAG TPA: ImmA/IrrE family metallo-endopeptidase [Candidatus Wunengus sp. YC64]|uniref:ImmA/IrrE family metallo-endopeptidase n=1 Tax=Candidatus Wunengus sp. YC64 TaxID=3367700 RepID=UPI004029D9FF